MPQTHEATLQPDGTLSFRNDVSISGSHRVLVTILDVADTPVEAETVDRLPLGDVRRTLQLLNSSQFLTRPYGSSSSIEAVIEENRDAWDE